MKKGLNQPKSFEKRTVQLDSTLKQPVLSTSKEQQKLDGSRENVGIPINLKSFIDKPPSNKGRKKAVKESLKNQHSSVQQDPKKITSLISQNQFNCEMDNENQLSKQNEVQIKIKLKCQEQDIIEDSDDQDQQYQNLANNTNKKIRKRGGERKTRTTISEEKIQLMMVLFNRYQNGIKYKGKFLTIKKIASVLGLGYSTILHKHRYYKQNGEIEKGVILKSKHIKRKYKKSHYIENLIKQAFEEKQFMTKSQLAKYLQEQKKLKISRGIVARHLNLMKNEMAESDSQSNLVRQEESQNLPKDKKDKNKFTTENNVLIDQKKMLKLELDEQAKKYQHLQAIERKKLSDKNKAIKSFGNLYFSLKQGELCCYYIDFIQFYYSNGKTSFQKPSQNSEHFNVKAMIVTSQVVIVRKDIQITYQLQSEVFKQKELNKYDAIMMEMDNGLLNELKLFPEINQANETNVYFIFGSNKTLEVNHAQQLSAEEFRIQLETGQSTNRKNIIEMPPYSQDMNFILKWFTTEIFPEIQENTFTNYFKLQDFIEDAIKRKQPNLKLYYHNMIQNLRNLSSPGKFKKTME